MVFIETQMTEGEPLFAQTLDACPTFRGRSTLRAFIALWPSYVHMLHMISSEADRLLFPTSAMSKRETSLLTGSCAGVMLLNALIT